MRGTLVSILFAALALAACGQREAELPDAGPGAFGGSCGPGYPGGADGGVDGGEGAAYAVEEGALFPCALWESARLDGEDTFVNVAQLFLEAKHGERDDAAIVVVVSAENCGPCAALSSAIVERRDDLEQAGAYMIGMARTDLQAPTEPYFDLDHAYEVLADEGWPVADWVVINDAEGYLPAELDSGTPWIIVVELATMEVLVASNLAFPPNESGVADLVDYLNAL